MLLKENEKITFFLPTRKGSERVKNKNTKQFSCYKGGLLENKLTQLSKCKKIDEIILSTNDEKCIEVAKPFLKYNNLIIDRRPDDLCLSTTNLEDLINYVPTITDAKHFIWGHVTTPITGSSVYDEAIMTYFAQLQKGYDSLLSVVELKNFLLNNKGKLINNTTDKSWPRTQDLESLYEINHAMFITSREVYLNHKNRIGKTPYLYLMNKIESVDIDWEEDFIIAEHLFNITNENK